MKNPKKNPAMEEDIEALYETCKELNGVIARIDRIAYRGGDEGIHKCIKETAHRLDNERKALAETAGVIEGVYRKGVRS